MHHLQPSPTSSPVSRTFGAIVNQGLRAFLYLKYPYRTQGEIVATEARDFGKVSSDYASKIIWNRGTQLPYLLYVTTSQQTKPLSELPLCAFLSFSLTDADVSDH